MTRLSQAPRILTLFLAVSAAALVGIACSDNEDDPPSAMNLTVSVEIASEGAPFTVEVNEPTSGGQGWAPFGFVHEVRVASNADETVRIDDARFAHEVREGDGVLVTAGRGCGANWEESTESISIACLDVLQIIRLEPNETHAYPVTVYPEVGPERLLPGNYVVEEDIPWWISRGDPFETGGEPEGTFTVRLTYIVE